MAEVREILQIKDLKKIKSIIFKHPELMSDNADAEIKKLIYNLFKTQEDLQKTRVNVRELESKEVSLQKKVKELSNLFDIEYETIEKEYIREEIALGLHGIMKYD